MKPGGVNPREPAPELVLTVPGALVDAIALRVVELLTERGASGGAAGPESPYMGVGEAADYLRADSRRIYDLIHSGALTPDLRSGERSFTARRAPDRRPGRGVSGGRACRHGQPDGAPFR